ncbi:MAG: GTPase, partial [Desulfobacterales bacterium]|nr:GTPase [Deltaproteobacteria bacterium]NNL41714.1 GTPase [Desulfobacterales bacterium]
PYLSSSIKETFEKYPNIGALLPAMGYSPEQMKDLETTINNTECDLVLSATPIDLLKLLTIEKPTMRIRYEYKDNSSPTLEEIITELMAEKNA